MKITQRAVLGLLLPLTALAQGQHAPTIETGPLPLRNVVIEVRQDDGRSETRERIGADVQARIEPGRSGGSVAIEARSGSTDRQTRARQQVMVLNGRPAAILLGNAVPLRLRQWVTQGGVRRSVPGTIWLDAGTGFQATPVWEGSDTVYLELVATQSRQALGAGARTATTLVLPLDEWITVAESDEDLDTRDTAAGLTGGGRDVRSGRQRLRVQVRVSVR